MSNNNNDKHNNDNSNNSNDKKNGKQIDVECGEKTKKIYIYSRSVLFSIS